jgi:hypothetical protein
MGRTTSDEEGRETMRIGYRERTTCKERRCERRGAGAKDTRKSSQCSAAEFEG